jgi:transposase
MPSGLDQRHSSPAAAAALTQPELIELVRKQEREIVNLRRQVAWFQRQIFGQKSERRLPEPERVQGSRGASFAIPDVTQSARKSPVAGHRRPDQTPSEESK